LQFKLSSTQQQVVDMIINKYQDKKEAPLSGKKAYTNGVSATDCTILGKVFADIMPTETISHAMVLVEFEPWVIHTDYTNNNDKTPASAILIPKDDIETSTLIFNEECTTESFKDFPIIQEHISKDIHKQYLSHCDWQQVQKVSLHEIYKWQKGTGVRWDRKALHSSDNFLINGVTTKTALTMFTEYVAN
jgi:hypothetical protein